MPTWKDLECTEVSIEACSPCILAPNPTHPPYKSLLWYLHRKEGVGGRWGRTGLRGM